ncbi:MAG: FMN-binding negative transcriptional regulator [Pseudomonadota bacterium]
MHPSSIFHTDEQAAREIISAHPLATLAANGPDGPVVAVVPLVWSEDETRLIGHVARTNAFWQMLQETDPLVTAVFHASDAYVSASAYPSKAEHGRVVPTWNYIAAEARGRLIFKTDATAIKASVSALSDQMEASRETPWAVSDAPEAYVDKLANAIVAFEIRVEAVKGVRKLSQNKSETDRAGVLSDLQQNNVGAQRLTEEMKLETQA